MTRDEWFRLAYSCVIEELGEGALTPFFKLALADEYDPGISPELGVLRVLHAFRGDDPLYTTVESSLQEHSVNRVHPASYEQEVFTPPNVY